MTFIPGLVWCREFGIWSRKLDALLSVISGKAFIRQAGLLSLYFRLRHTLARKAGAIKRRIVIHCERRMFLT
jgi:hypothetical protein